MSQQSIVNGQMHDLEFVFVVVLYYEIWPKVMLRSLRKIYNNEVILVNHLHRDVPSEYRDERCTVLQMGHGTSHGAGIDTAVDYLRSHNIRYFVLIEPDCVITGTEWLDKMIQAVNNGAAMAGPNRLPFGPIHPCPSIWDITQIPGSFKVSDRDISIDFGIFNYKDMIKWLMNNNADNGSIHLWCHKWDCGLKNWYILAKKGLAIHTHNSDGFKHFYEGRNRSPMDLIESEMKMIAEYL